MKMFMKPENNSHWHELFRYEPSTGHLVNRAGRGTRAKAGSIAGCQKRGDAYVQIGIAGKYHNAHRIIWEMVRGPVPNGMVVAHKNGRRYDNRLVNLSLVSRADIAANARKHAVKK